MHSHCPGTWPTTRPPGRHHQGTKFHSLHIEWPGPTTTNPWTCEFRSYLLPSYSTDFTDSIWKTIKKLDIWHTSRLKQTLQSPRHLTHLDDTTKVPSFIHHTLNDQGPWYPPPDPPGHTIPGPILLLSCLIHSIPRISIQPELHSQND